MSHSPEVIAAAKNLKETIEAKRAQMQRRQIRRSTLICVGMFGAGAVVSGIVSGGFGYSLGMDQAQSASSRLENVPAEAGHYRLTTDVLSPDGTPLAQPQYRVWCEPTSGHGTLHEALDAGNNYGTPINIVPQYEGCPSDMDAIRTPAPLTGLVEITE